MAVGFGFSVGDVIAVLRLILVAADALDRSGKSGASFRALGSEIKTSASMLEIIHGLKLDDDQLVKKLAIQQATAQSLTILRDFETQISK